MQFKGIDAGFKLLVEQAEKQYLYRPTHVTFTLLRTVPSLRQN